MAENTLNGNEAIERAIAALNAAQSREKLIAALEAIRAQMNRGASFLVPVEVPQSALDQLDLTTAKPGDIVQAKKNLRLVIRKLKMETGDEYLAAFTSPAEVEKGEATLTIASPISAYLENILHAEGTAGIVLDPWSEPFLLTKDMIGVILEVNKKVQPKSRICFELGDITKIDCECIVNAANSSLLGGGGVDGAIHRAAGPELLEACRKLDGCNTGEAKLTKGYRLKADYVIHTVGPVYSGQARDETLLAGCYRNALTLAQQHGIHSIAFPAISTGAYGYPLREAAPIAMLTVSDWLDANVDYSMSVIFCCFDQQTYDSYQAFLGN